MKGTHTLALAQATVALHLDARRYAESPVSKRETGLAQDERNTESAENSRETTFFGAFQRRSILRGADRFRGGGPRWRYQEPPRKAQSATLCAFVVPNNGKMGNSQCHGMALCMTL